LFKKKEDNTKKALLKKLLKLKLPTFPFLTGGPWGKVAVVRIRARTDPNKGLQLVSYRGEPH